MNRQQRAGASPLEECSIEMVLQNKNERFPVSSLTDGLKRVTTDVERVDLWLVGMVSRRRR